MKHFNARFRRLYGYVSCPECGRREAASPTDQGGPNDSEHVGQRRRPTGSRHA